MRAIIDNILSLDIINTIDNNLEKIQKNFLETTLGSIVDNGINIGIKSIFPDFIEDQIIEVKDTFFQEGVKSAVNEAISSAIDIGKSTIGIFTGNFENISQIQQVVKKGGLLDAISSILDTAIDFAKDNGLIDKSIAKALVAGKKSIINNVSSNIENSLTEQIKSVEKLNTYSEKWMEAYNNKDLTQMNKLYKSVKTQLKNTIPLENTINKAREIENLQTLITNNGGNFDISFEALELSKIL